MTEQNLTQVQFNDGVVEPYKVSKSDLVNIVAGKLEFTKKDVKLVLNCLFDTVADLIVDGNIVTIQNFGRFYIREAKPRSFRKVRTDEIISVGYRNLPKVRFSKELVSRVKTACPVK